MDPKNNLTKLAGQFGRFPLTPAYWRSRRPWPATRRQSGKYVVLIIERGYLRVPKYVDTIVPYFYDNIVVNDSCACARREKAIRTV